MKSQNSNQVLWIELTDDRAEAVNGGGGHKKSYDCDYKESYSYDYKDSYDCGYKESYSYDCDDKKSYGCDDKKSSCD
jgi:hypothetical protein